MMLVALSRSADMLGESMKKEILITEDDIHNKFSLHYYEPPIFQGLDVFNLFLKKVIARWDELRIHSIAEVESILQNIVNFEETKGLSCLKCWELVNCIRYT